MTFAFPFFLFQLQNPQIKDFHDSFVVWERTFFSDFPETGVDAFNGIGCIYDLSDSWTIVEELLYMSEISFPDSNGSRVLGPFLFKQGKQSACFILRSQHGISVSVPFPQKFTAAVPGNISKRISNQMDDAALNNGIREDGPDPFLC